MARILIADDEPDIRELLTFALNYAGHEVLATANGEEALNTAIQELPDLILLDVRMPRMDGFEACRRIKANPDTLDIPIVFLSAKGQDQDIRTGLKAGAVDYLLKPFAPDQLLIRLNEIVERAGDRG